MSAVGTAVRTGMARRRLQTAVTFLACVMAVTASVLGCSLLVASQAPFDRAFARQHGAQLSVLFDASKAQPAQVAQTAHAAGVTGAAGPFPSAQTDPGPGTGMAALPAGMSMPTLTIVGRAAPGGPVDDVTLTAGHWPSGAGQIVVSADWNGPEISVGEALQFPDAPGSPQLTIVGTARSVSRTADAWATPDQVDALVKPGSAARLQMLYRFAAADTAARLAADRAAVTAAAPAGSLTGAVSWLDVKRSDDANTGVFVPFLAAFGLLGVAMSVLIVANVVAGAVGSGTRRIGILKAIGFTPGQVVAAYTGQALIPAAVGAALGAVLGNEVASAVLAKTEQIYGTTSLTVAPGVEAAVVAGALMLVAVTAVLSALRAGRLRTVDALAVGRGSDGGRGRRAMALTARLPLPRPVTMGLARPFARPARSAAMTAAVLFGATAVTFAVGLGTSLTRLQDAKSSKADVTVYAVAPPGPAAAAAGSGSRGAGAPPPPGAPGGPGSQGTTTPTTAAPTSASPGTSSGTAGTSPAKPADPAVITAAIKAAAGTRAFYGTAQAQVAIGGAAGSVTVDATVGDASWSGLQLVAGRWYNAPGEAVAPTTLLTAAGAKVGDTITVLDHGTAIPVRVTGEAFSTQNQGLILFTDARTLAAAEPDLKPVTFSILLAAGTERMSYLSTLNAALAPTGALALAGGGGGASDLLILLGTLTAFLTLLLVVVAGLGVLNAVVLDTRDRIRDLGVVKALGMTPRQTVGMVVASVATVGAVGGCLGVPIGVLLQRLVVPAMGSTAGLKLPQSALHVYQGSELLALGAGGLVIAVLGALAPATWAARTRTAVALRTE